MTEYDIRFSPSSSKDGNAFRLLELTSDLCNLIQSNSPSLVVKGQAGEDAVLCTSDKTYALRSVVLSNSMLVVSPHPTESAAHVLVIRDQLNEIMELVPSVPKLHKLGIVLRGMEYDDGQDEMGSADGTRPPERRKFTYDDARAEIQASDHELDRALKERRILNINGELRPIGPSYLTTILELLLNYLVLLSLSHETAPADELAAALMDEHEISRQISFQVMSWFGELMGGKWKMDVDTVIKEVGLSILRKHKDDPIPEDDFISAWKSAVGDTFGVNVSLALLLGNYLSNPSPTSHLVSPLLTYLSSSSLPIEPAARFADLFLIRSRWKGEDIIPFLSDIAVDSKEREKLLLKYARANAESEGVSYTARAQYYG